MAAATTFLIFSCCTPPPRFALYLLHPPNCPWYARPRPFPLFFSAALFIYLQTSLDWFTSTPLCVCVDVVNSYLPFQANSFLFSGLWAKYSLLSLHEKCPSLSAAKACIAVVLSGRHLIFFRHFLTASDETHQIFSYKHFLRWLFCYFSPAVGY